MKSMSISNICRRGRYAFLLAVCLPLASCQTTQTRSSMEARYFDATDPCQPVKNRLIATQDHFSRNIAGGVAIGIITGIVTGLQSGDRKKVFRNAVIGGLTGAAAGYLKGKIEQARSREDLRKAINSDVRQDTRKVTEMGTILRSLNDCRRGQVFAIKQGFDEGGVSAEQTRVALQNVRASVQQDNTLIEEILGEVTERKGVYVASIGQVENKTEEEVLGNVAASTPETSPEVVATTRYFAQKGSNVRAQPSTNASVLGVLPVGTPVEVVGSASNGEWYEVRYEDREAYVYAELLDTTVPATTTASPATVEVAARPKAENDVQELDRVSREVRDEREMAVAELEREIEELEELTLLS